MSAVAEIARKLDQGERAHQLSIAAIAARGKGDDIKKMIKDWSEE